MYEYSKKYEPVEEIQDILAAIFGIAESRAEVFHRGITVEDLFIGAYLLCFPLPNWPKAAEYTQYMQVIRPRLIQGASISGDAYGRIKNFFTGEILSLAPEQISARLQTSPFFPRNLGMKTLRPEIINFKIFPPDWPFPGIE